MSREKDKEQVANRRVCKLASLGRMRQRLEERQHSGLRDLIANHTFVGCVDRQFSLLQVGNRGFLFGYFSDTRRSPKSLLTATVLLSGGGVFSMNSLAVHFLVIYLSFMCYENGRLKGLTF